MEIVDDFQDHNDSLIMNLLTENAVNEMESALIFINENPMKRQKEVFTSQMIFILLVFHGNHWSI